jgi:uncharacterized protein YjbI with pentapeptide repeats
LRAADLNRVDLEGADLGDADLSDACLDFANFKTAVLDGANLSRASMAFAKLEDAHLRSADLSSAHGQGASFARADLTRADLSSAKLVGASFEDAALSSADLRGADLSGASLLRTDLRGAHYDRDTRFPDGFDLGPAGLVFSPEARLNATLTSFRPGQPYPLGATWDGAGVNFALHAPGATHVDLCLFDRADAPLASARIRLPEQTDGIWHIYVPHLAPGQLYAYRVYGPYRPDRGLRAMKLPFQSEFIPTVTSIRTTIVCLRTKLRGP